MSQKYKTLKTIGNHNNYIGVPLTILRLKDHTAAVIEMGMSNKNQIRERAKLAKPNMAVITNIGTAHIGNLGTRENILNAKLEMIEQMNAEEPVIINNDNDMLNAWYLKNKDKRRIITYGIENKSDIMAKNIKLMENGSKFEVQIGNKTYLAEVNVRRKTFRI